MNWFLHAFRLTVSINFNNWQWTIDNWHWNSRWADSWFLKTFSLNSFILAVSIAYCLAFPDCLNAFSLNSFSLAFPDCLKTFSLNSFILAVPIAIGALPQTLPPFLSWYKKGGKKGQDGARFARKMVVRKAQIVQLVEVRWSFYKGERAWHELQLRTGTIFNRLPRLFFGSPDEVEGREVIGNDQWIDFFMLSD